MSTGTKLAGFVVAAVAVLGIAVLVGRAVGPVADEPVAHDDMAAGGHGGHDDSEESDDMDGMEGMEGMETTPAGLQVSQDGYTLALADPTPAAGKGVELAFEITGPDGEPLTSYDVEHEKELHLIVVRRDLDGFQHVHPVLGDDGTWRVDVDLTAGDWRVFADFKPTGAEALTLGADLAVGGSYEPAPPTEEQRTATVGDYEVTLDGDLVAGTDAELTLSVTKDGEPVTDLDPYLGAYGHLVALRGGDLAYLHVHPDGEPGDGTTEPGPEIVFYAAVPSAGTYHLFLDFQHEGVVRTAAFTLSTSGEGASEESEHESGEETNGGHSH